MDVEVMLESRGYTLEQVQKFRADPAAPMPPREREALTAAASLVDAMGAAERHFYAMRCEAAATVFKSPTRIIQETVSALYGIARPHIIGPRRRNEFVKPRQIAVWIAYQLAPGASIAAIGRAFGGRDHTTILYTVRKVPVMMAADPAYKAEVDRAMAACEEALPVPLKEA
jgi:chromosomal replication initiation ATPase DnaA